MSLLNTMIYTSLRLFMLCSLICLLLPTNLVADENLFGYVYGAETLPKGKWEAYQWLTSRVGKGKGRYLGLDAKTEIEYGISDRFQLSLYFNNVYHNIRGAAPKDEAGVPEYSDKNSFEFQGNQVAFKYMVLSPYKDPFGLAFYFEPGYSRVDKITGEMVEEYELEYKVILQKNFLDDSLIYAFNYTLEQEWERGAGESEFDGELIMEWAHGLSYRIFPKWYVGVENRWHTEFPNMDISNQEHLGVFLGPTIHYGDKKWWATLTVLPQIYGWPDDPERGEGLHLEEHEQMEVRLKVGFNF